MALAVQFLHVNVLHIGHEHGKSPGRMVIMPGNHPRYTGSVTPST